MILRRLTVDDYPAFERYIADWAADTSPFKIEETDAYKDIRTADDFVRWLTELKSEEIVPKRPNYSPATKYFAVAADGEIAGVVSCRWDITKGILLEWGGHIGYGVAPSHRGQGTAAEMVRRVLPEYRARGIERVMISCDDANVASSRTIEKNGGVLENIVDIDGDMIRRYWIDLTND